MTDASLPRLTLRQRWHRLRTSPRFPFVLFLGLLVAGGLSQVYSYWWGVRLQRMLDRNKGTAERIDLFPVKLNPFFGKHIQPLEPVRSVTIYHEGVSGEDLRVLRSTPFLRELTIYGELSPEAREQLGCLTQIRDLHFDSRSTKKADVDVLAKFPRLETLSLSYGQTNNPAVYQLLAAMPHLKRLELEYPQAANLVDGFRELAHLSSLQRLDARFQNDKLLLAMTCMLPDGRPPLQSLLELRICYSAITDAALVNLRNLPSLVHLDLSRTRVTDAGLVHLKSLPYLRTLYIGGNVITDQGAVLLAGMHNLESLNIGDTKLTKTGIMEIARMPRLRSLRIYASSEWLDDLRQRLPPDCKINHY